ncbi:hypothetical protein CEXT_658321 [Caerostris extrusa]|uniref:Helitron helicase-like domain-containing protein n=1 Tax=Caerostris extrusa TaxID=172846 RepID=A0AAV4R276_CAEEX|nr:hypothetical protein CEXT_658321 [Caerostris extrusa]
MTCRLMALPGKTEAFYFLIRFHTEVPQFEINIYRGWFSLPLLTTINPTMGFCQPTDFTTLCLVKQQCLIMSLTDLPQFGMSPYSSAI